VIPRFHGVVDWNIHPDGDVAIEHALVGMGYQVKHIYDDKGVDEIEVHEALVTEYLVTGLGERSQDQ
jgi:hypothetical protein